MSSAITVVGQTRINELRGLELPLVIDRMILALIPGLDPDLSVDRNQQMPDPGDIVHTYTIDSDHKGYVNPDQVVYSMILGSDIGNFSFNWIGTVEAVTNNIITVTTTPESSKRKTNLATNTTGNVITRNVMMQFIDAQVLTGVTISAETWQFDYMAELNEHFALELDPTDIDEVKNRHLSNAQAKAWQDHTNNGFVHRGYRAGDEISLPYVPSAQEMIDRRMLQRNGDQLLIADCPDLNGKIGRMYTPPAVDAQYFWLMDDRGLFERIWDNGAIVDKGTITIAGDTTTGSAIITNISSTEDLESGMLVTGAGIVAGSTILTINSGTQIALSANTTATATGVILVSTNRIDRGDGTGGDAIGSGQNDGNKKHSHGIGPGGYGVSGTYGGFVGTLENIQSTKKGGNETRVKNRNKWGGIFY